MANPQVAKSKKHRQDRKKERLNKDQANGKATGKKGKHKSWAREWFDALLFALIAAVIIRTFFFEAFRIPTPSMEKSLLVGDFLLVSKLHYGTRTPITLGIPFVTEPYLPFELPFFRLPGFRSVERGEAFVFNYPPEEKPIDRKTHYIKRAMGVPGDTLAMIEKVLHVNGKAVPISPEMEQEWIVRKSSPEVRLPGSRLRDLGIEQVINLRDPNEVLLRFATTEAADEIKQWSYVQDVYPRILPAGSNEGGVMFPQERHYSRDNYGPIVIPFKGQKIELTDESWPLYKKLITQYEHHTARRAGPNRFTIDGQPATTYIIEQDYYFAMGDNRDNSLDSRAWGFVPQDHVVGKAFLIYFSWDTDNNFPRFGRLFNLIH